jgi:hypothetical protein
MRPSRSVLSKFGIIAIMFAAGFTATAQAQAVKIRVINSNNDRPLAKQSISVNLLYDTGQKVPAEYAANLLLEADVNGEAQFRLPEPTPAHLWVRLYLTSERWRCDCAALITTEGVLQKGIVKALLPANKAKAEPGAILFLVRPFTFLERLLYPLIKE